MTVNGGQIGVRAVSSVEYLPENVPLRPGPWPVTCDEGR